MTDRYKSKSSSSTSVEAVPDVDEQNEATKGLRKGSR